MSSNEFQTYQMIRLLGEGAYGKAYLVRSNTDMTYSVIKIINIENMTEKEKKDTLTESRILKQLEHQNIIKLKEVFMAKKPHFTLNIVTEYADGGDLAKRIKEQRGNFFSESQIVNWFTQIALALYHIHCKLIIHRDIKPQNVFLTKNGDVKLGDFGIAKCLEGTWQKAITCIGTPYYLSPEILMDKPYSFKTDIWSLGVLLYQMTMLRLPFDSNSFHKLTLKILKGKFSPIADCFSVELKGLVKALLQTNPDKRPNIKEVLKTPLVQKAMNEIEIKKEVYLSSVDNKAKNHNIVRKSNISKKKNSNKNESNNRYLNLVSSIPTDEDTN